MIVGVFENLPKGFNRQPELRTTALTRDTDLVHFFLEPGNSRIENLNEQNPFLRRKSGNTIELQKSRLKGKEKKPQV